MLEPQRRSDTVGGVGAALVAAGLVTTVIHYTMEFHPLILALTFILTGIAASAYSLLKHGGERPGVSADA